MKKIKLSRGKFTTVDDADYASLNRYKWYAVQGRSGFYAVRAVRNGEKQTKLRMHRVITGANAGLVVDHRNHNTLDNRRSNLLPCSNSDNGFNRRGAAKHSRSRIRGVSYIARDKKWKAQVRKGGRYLLNRQFKSKKEAVRAVKQFMA